MKKRILIVLGITLSLSVFAQTNETPKFGHINKQDVFALLPEADAAMKELEALLLNYKMESKKLEEEFTKKQQEYAASQDKLEATIKKYRETELQRLYQSIEEFSKNAETGLQKKQAELLAPIETKINEAITKVGDENGFIYIFDVTNPGTFAYMSSKSINVLPLVKVKLGIK